MREPSTSELSARIDRLTRQNCFLKRWLMVVTCAVSIGALVTAAPVRQPAEVKARLFMLVDDKNTTRAVLGLSDQSGDPC
jgi:hypothetical protein